MMQHSKLNYFCLYLWLLPLSLLSQTLPSSQRVGDVQNTGQFIVGSNNKIIYVSAAQNPPRRELKSIGLLVPLKLHHQFELEAAVYEFDKVGSSTYENTSKYRLLDSKQLEARTLILTALKRYAQSLADLQQGTTAFHEDDLQTGLELQSFSHSGAKSLLDEFPGSSEATNAIAASLSALGRYLVTKRNKADEPRLLQAMEPVVEQLCSFIAADIDILRVQSRQDFSRMAQQQVFFLRTAMNMSGSERREEIRKLPAIYENSDSVDESFTSLITSINRFASTNKYIVAESQRKRHIPSSQLNKLLVTSERL